MRKYILWLAVLALSAATAGAATINVPVDQLTIQAGIDAAASGDTVLVAPNTYTADGNRDIDFGGKAVVLLSQSGPDVTIIDCQGTPSVPHRGFYFHTGEDSTAIIEGFTIRNGHGPLYGFFITVSRGGGILCDSTSSPRITNCVFENNVAASMGGGTGGAIYCSGGSLPIIEDCRFTGNTANGGLQGKGGGVGTEGAAAVFVNCTFSGNSACLGGGVSIQDSVAYFDNCEFTDNSALAYDAGKTAGSGAGLCLSKSASRLTNCVFSENTSYAYVDSASTDAAGKGGGLTCNRSAAILVNCTFQGNVAERPSLTTGGKGGGIYCLKASPFVERTIIAFNESDGIYCDSADSNPMLFCCNVYGNDNGLGDWVGCIMTQDSVADNFSAHPRFCSLFPPDLTLQDNSPCTPANSPCGELVGALAVACPASAVEDQDNIGELPDMFTLKQNYPNPFNPATAIDYALPERLHVTLTVYNVLGQEIATLVDESQAAGSHRAIWHGTDKQGRPVSSGVYLYRLSTEKFRQSKKMILLK